MCNMDDFRIVVFILCGISVVAALTGKGYYCRDPDTGFLHPANSTWQSTTFCGNFTCKLRKKTPENLLRAINVTFVNGTESSENRSAIDEESVTNDTVQEADKLELTPDSPELVILKSLLPLGLNDMSKLNIHERLKYNPLVKDEKTIGTGDRFLTDDEIKTISELLHNVKKSDLEAIVDIYNLAQDIYKEMDKMTSENIVEETMKSVNSKPDQKTYWYDLSDHKGFRSADMDHQGSNVVTSTAVPSADPNTYFGGILSPADFGKLPYYYPMSSFQRQSSYVHPTYNIQPPAPYKPPCAAQVIPPPPVASPAALPAVPPVASPYLSPYYSSPYYPSHLYGGVQKKPFTVETQKEITPSNYLPYPFAYVQQHYNVSNPQNSFYSELPSVSTGNSITNQKSNHKTHFYETPSIQLPATSEKKESTPKLETDKKKPEVESLIDTLLANVKTITKIKPEWQTDPIPVNVLEEVRAHFEEKSKLLKPLSLRKKVKLERVGKVVKLDDLLREKRSLENEDMLEEEVEEELEAYIEKTTCETDVDPGYFRLGNMSEPFPVCCPQRINKDKR